MDILSEGSGNPSQDLDLQDLVDVQPVNLTVPQSEVINRSATDALVVSTPDNLIENYRNMVEKGTAGSDEAHQEVMRSIEDKNRQRDMPHFIGILGDPNIPIERKQAVMDFVQKTGFKEEPAMTLQTNALTAESQGEDLRGETARLHLADTLREMQTEREDRQRMVNHLAATLPDASAGTIGEMAQADVMPFGRNVIAAKIQAKLNELEGVPTTMGDWVKNFLLPGSTKANIQDKLRSIPPDQRDAYTRNLLSAISESASIFPSANYYAQYKAAVELLDSPEHTNGDVWVENMGTLFDLFAVGGAAVSLAKGLRGASKVEQATKDAATGSPKETVESANWELVDTPTNPFAPRIGEPKKLLENKKTEDTYNRLEVNSVVRRENPASPLSLIEQANPEKARNLNKAIGEGDEEFARAVAGVSREQALANHILPQVGVPSGNVFAKVSPEIVDALNNTGATRYTTQELQGAVDTIINDYRNVTALQPNDVMSTFRVDGDKLIIDAHYETVGGRFDNAQDALDQAKYAFRKYGVSDNDLTLMKREGMDFVPVTGDKLTPDGEYMVRVRTVQDILDTDVPSWNSFDVKRNWSDRVSWTGSESSGNVSGWLFDPGSMLHPTLTGSASIGVDQAITLETVLLNPIKQLRTTLESFPKDRVAKVEEYMLEANMKGIPHDPFTLVSRGFNEKEIDALRQWKDIWDGHYYLENFDLIRSIRSQGFEVFDHNGTQLFAKRVEKNQNIGRVYDPSTDSISVLGKAEMDQLYDTGGHYAALRRPIDVDGVMVDHMIVRNTPSEYLRGLRDTDKALNYRDGYFTINYKAPKFIDKIITDPKTGVETRSTVAVAGNTKDADLFVKGQTATTGVRHEVREDKRGFRKDGDGYWDLNSASGRIAQRRRGAPLEAAQGVNNLGIGSYIENPLESAVRSAKSLSERTSMRPIIETAKRRFVSQYGDLLENNGYGGKSFPSSRTSIVDRADHTSKRVADARTTYGYINMLEHGYINTADEIYKGGMNIIANYLGKYHLSGAERTARSLEDVSPSTLAKGTVYQAYIAMSLPIRQWIVQAHQSGRMMAYNPVGFMNGEVPKLFSSYAGLKSGLVAGSKEAKAFEKFVDDSGMVAGVDRNSLVRGIGLSMADSSSKLKRGIGEVAALPQTVGFDIGEKANMLMHLAAVYEKKLREGINLADKTQRDLALTEARSLALDLNRAGELTYTQSSPALLMQFLQMPQKAYLQATNRKIPASVKMRVMAWDLLMFGGFTSIIGAVVNSVGGDGDDILPEDSELRSVMTDGLEPLIMNRFFTMLDDSGTPTNIDFESLSPYEMDGFQRMASSFFEDGFFGMLASSPAGQLFAVGGTNGARRNGRIPQALLTIGRYFGVREEFDPNEPTKFTDVLNDVAKITSGWNSIDQAKLMLETRKKLDASGSVVANQVTIPEIWAQGLGFPKKSTNELYKTTKKILDTKKEHEEQVMQKYRDIVQYYTVELRKENPDIEKMQKVGSMLMRTFDDPADLAMVQKQWSRDLMGKEAQLFKLMVDATGAAYGPKLIDTIRNAPVPEETKAKLIQRVKDFENIRSHNEEMRKK